MCESVMMCVECVDLCAMCDDVLDDLCGLC